MSTEIVKQDQPDEVAPSNVLQALVVMARTPGISIDVIERMVALQERQEARQAQTAFFAALTQLQAEIPIIHKGGKNSFTGSTYARREDIKRQLQPLLAKYGFAFSLDEESGNGETTTFIGKLSHNGGHFEIKRKTLRTDHAAKNRDGKATRTAIQDDGSTTSYAARYLLKMHLDIAETDEDTDGNDTELITEDQARDLQCLLDGCGADKKSFLELICGTKTIAEIPARDWSRVLHAAEVKAKVKK